MLAAFVYAPLLLQLLGHVPLALALWALLAAEEIRKLVVRALAPRFHWRLGPGGPAFS